MLAQIYTDTLQWAGGAASLFFFVGGVNAILKLVDRLRGQPPAEQLKVMADDLNKRLCRLEAQREVDCREQEERRRALYSHVDKTRLELKEDIKALDTKIGVMPVEIVALLRNTGAIE
jgi:hypothetical protein